MDILHAAKGCESCNYLGYRGRIAIYEALEISEELKRLTLKRASVYELRRESRKMGTMNLREAGIKKVEEGLTTMEEILQATVDIGE